MPDVTIKQTAQELNEIRAQLVRVLEPFKLNWEDAPTLAMLGGYMHKHFVTDGVIDASFSNMYSAVKALKAHLSWDGDAPRTAPKIVTDEKGRVIRDLRGDRQRKAQQDAEDAQQPRRDLESERKDAMQRVAVNQKIEMLREELNSFRGRTHSDTYKGRAEMQAELDATIRNKRNLLGVSECEDRIRAISLKYWPE